MSELRDSNDDQNGMQAQLLAEGEALRRLARQLLGHRDDAEDVVQDACVAALGASATAQPRQLGPWLSGMVKNLAHLHRRRQRRRIGREHDAAAQRVASAQAGVDAASLAAQAELVRHLGSAVHALDEPFRTVVLLRFWRGLLPDAIAAELGVPRNTVRSRLQRGVERLRVELDRKYGERRAWAAPLGVLGGARGAMTTTATVTATASPLGLAVLLMKTKLILTAAAVLGLATLVPLAWGSAPPAAPELANRAPSASTVASSVPSSTADELPVEAPRVVAAPPSVSPRPMPSAEQALVRGRCVDASGGPVPQCLARLHASAGPSAASPVTEERTDAAGRFELHCARSAESVQVSLQRAGLVGMAATLPELRGAQVYDLGDVVMVAGCVVIGRLTTSNGTLPTGCQLAFLRSDGVVPDAVPRAAMQGTAISDAGGSFTTVLGLSPGAWQVRLRSPYELVDAAHTFSITSGQSLVRLDLEAKAVTAVARGFVVDEAQRPIAGASVSPSTLFGVLSSLDCGSDGGFCFPRLEGSTDTTVALTITAPGHRTVRRTLTFDAASERIELQRCPEVQLEVVRAADGVAVETYAAHVVPAPGANDLQRRLRSFGPAARPSGRLSLPDLEPGRYLAWIEPDDAQLAAFLGEFTIERAAVIRLLAPPAAPRLVRVLDADDGAVVGTRVELLLGFEGASASVNTPALPPRRLPEATALGALLVQSGTTDERGELTLQSAADTRFVVRAMGPGHRPVLAADVLLSGNSASEPPAPLVLRVDAGATVIGTVGPALLRQQFGANADERKLPSEMHRSMAPQVFLRDRRDPARRWPERAIDGAVDDDGAFRIDGIPAGDWQVCVQLRLLATRSAGSMHTLVEPVASLGALAAGEERHLDIDLGHLAFGSVHAQVFVDGQPLLTSRVDVITRRSGLVVAGKSTNEAQLPTSTDSTGRLTADLPPGEYWLEAVVPGVANREARLHSEQSLRVVAGQVSDVTMQLRRRTMRVRVLQADGAPTRARRFSLLQASYLVSVGSTDAEGWLTIESVRPGPFELVTWPTELSEQKAQTDYIRQHPYPQWIEGMLHLEGLEMPTGQLSASFERRLPRGSSRRGH